LYIPPFASHVLFLVAPIYLPCPPPAAAWASLASIGRAGFVQRTKDIVSCTRKIAAGVAKMDGLFLMGPNQAMIVCFGAKEVSGWVCYDDAVSA